MALTCVWFGEHAFYLEVPGSWKAEPLGTPPCAASESCGRFLSALSECQLKPERILH